ncbi:penicillin acylase family protein (plasmid) [Streptomyces cellulosae]|nr:penicillin acylase family protein [Streptomyces cellulosae]WTB86685.1 penicillin acylase family protein [Streptomyces cellulosae]
MIRALGLSGPVRRVVGSLLALLVIAGVQGASASAVQAGSGRQVVIRYTEYGIPHIKASDFDGLGLGYGYAAAKDNICLLADTYLTVDAERSRYLGADAPANSALGVAADSLTSDLYFQQVKDSGIVERLAGMGPPDGPEPDVKKLVSGYVEGYNRYLSETGVNHLTDPACRGAAWVRPITELDVYRHLYAITTVTGSGQLMNAITASQPPTSAAAAAAASAAQVSPTEAARRVRAARDAEQAESMGSNAIAVGSAGTTAGGSVLLGNPHFPWQGARRFWQSQLTIPGKFNVSGASLLGFPAILIGHNQDVAWSHTVSTATTFGLYQVQTVPGSPTTYLVDGKPEKMRGRSVTVEVRQPDGSLGSVERTLWSTRYGPVVNAIPGISLPWGTTAYSVRDANATNLRALNAWLRIGRAHDTGDIADALTTTQGLPWVNTIATDRTGSALYADIQVVPHVTNELAADCSTPLGKQVFAANGLAVLDGSRGTCAWGSDSDAVEPGILGPSRLPKLTRDDYVANSNDSPWLANPAAPLIDYPRIVGDIGTTRSVRTQEGITAVRRRLSGTDGLPGKGFSLDTMRRTLFSDHSRVAELAAADTARMCASFEDGKAPSSSGPVDVSTACAALESWDGSYRVGSRGALLFARFAARLSSVPGGAWQSPFDPADPVNTPNTLATTNSAVQRAFGDAAAELTAAGIALDAPLGQNQYVTRGANRMAIHGAPNSLGVLNVITPVWDAEKGNTEVVYGSSFIQVVEFTAGRSPKTSTLLTYSQSADPTSAHYADQTALFSAGRWVTDRFTERDIASSPRLRVHRLVAR